MKVLLIGSGAREHALAWKIRQSPLCQELWCAPGNPGIASVANCLPIPAHDPDALTDWATSERPDLVVIGPEAPLVAGLADRLRAAGVDVFGPSARAARIEGSKAYARDLMARMGVPQPAYAACRDFPEADAYLNALAEQGAAGAVVKADGLAAGKGAIVCDDLRRARDVAREMLVDRSFGSAGAEIVIEERLIGEEASLLVLTDGANLVPFLPAQDYKRAYDGDLGPNTGGMGAYAPAPVLTEHDLDEALRTIIEPVLRGLREDGAPFQGCLYAGLMKTAAGLKVIEFNCRFGDPEAEAVLPLLENDLLPLLRDAARGELSPEPPGWRPEHAVCVVMASGGYPGAMETGKPVAGLRDAEAKGCVVFHAGTAEREGAVVTAGGRVLAVTAVRPGFAEARRAAYAVVAAIHFDGAEFRTDIAAGVV